MPKLGQQGNAASQKYAPAASVRRVAKRLLGFAPPWIGLRLLATFRWLARPSVRARAQRIKRVIRALGSPDRVMRGPFAGMRYVGPAFAGQGGYLPKLLGSYEAECAIAVERLIARQPDRLINVGAAEGYYAVGFLTRLPNLRVEAFEAERPYHAAIRALAASNGVDRRLSIRGVCGAIDLEHALASATRPIVVMDCEGGELELLNIHDVPSLMGASILVELHEALRPGVTEIILDRVSPTHRVTRIATRSRSLRTSEVDTELTRADQDFAHDEGRCGEMEWLLLECE